MLAANAKCTLGFGMTAGKAKILTTASELGKRFRMIPTGTVCDH